MSETQEERIARAVQEGVAEGMRIGRETANDRMNAMLRGSAHKTRARERSDRHKEKLFARRYNQALRPPPEEGLPEPPIVRRAREAAEAARARAGTEPPTDPVEAAKLAAEGARLEAEIARAKADAERERT